MKKIEVIDVTLRDGGYKTNFHFKERALQQILIDLDKSGIEYIEIGYRNGPLKAKEGMGDASYCQRDYIQYCARFIQHAKMTVMLHPQHITEADLKEMQESGVKAVRLCFSPQHRQATLNVLKLLKHYSFDTFVNLTRVSQYGYGQLLEWVLELSQFQIKAIYFADSNGGLTPSQITELFRFMCKHVNIPFGFHAHDNLFLAQANAIAALDAGAQYLDATLHGLGKGGGNLRTELITTFLNHTRHNYHYDVCYLMDTAALMGGMMGVPLGNLSVKDIIHGVFNLSQDDISRLDECADTHRYYAQARQLSANKTIVQKTA